MAAYFYFCALLAVATACSPGGGNNTPSRSPTFSFKYSPPVRWTFGTPATRGQQNSEAKAEKKATNDIELAIYRAMSRYNIPTSSAKIDTKNVKTPNVTLTTDGKCPDGKEATKYADNGKTVNLHCDVDKTGSPYILDGSIRVTTPIDYMEYQWKALVDEVQSNLEDIGVDFDGEVKIRL